MNDLVLIVDEGQRNGWLRGRVVAVNAGSDGRIRQATVESAGGIFRRPVSKLAVLQVQGNSNTDVAERSLVHYGLGDFANARNTGKVKGGQFCNTSRSRRSPQSCRLFPPGRALRITAIGAYTYAPS